MMSVISEEDVVRVFQNIDQDMRGQPDLISECKSRTPLTPRHSLSSSVSSPARATPHLGCNQCAVGVCVGALFAILCVALHCAAHFDFGLAPKQKVRRLLGTMRILLVVAHAAYGVVYKTVCAKGTVPCSLRMAHSGIVDSRFFLCSPVACLCHGHCTCPTHINSPA